MYQSGAVLVWLLFAATSAIPLQDQGWIEVDDVIQHLCTKKALIVENVHACRAHCRTIPECKGVSFTAEGKHCQIVTIPSNKSRVNGRCETTRSGSVHYLLLNEGSDCEDDDDECEAWAATGECASNTAYMMTHCKASCCKVASNCTRARCDDTEVCPAKAAEGQCSEIGGTQLHTCPHTCCGSCKMQIKAQRPGQLTPRQRAVVLAFKWAWDGYRAHAWGKDMLLPVSQGTHEWFGLGLSLVDGIDTLLIMKKVVCASPLEVELCTWFHEQARAARDWVANEMDLARDRSVNLFEVTIRVLGGLLAAYHLSHDAVYLEKATELGEGLLPALTKSPTGIPHADVNLRSRHAHNPTWTVDSSISEVTTIQLEFKYLAQLTGRKEFWSHAERVMEKVAEMPKWQGLVPIHINPNTGKWSGNLTTLGARGDSYYEYLLKQYLITNSTEERFWDRYAEAMQGIHNLLVKQTETLTYIAEADGGQISKKMDHLVCFLPGLLALGAYSVPDKVDPRDMDLAKKLAETCYAMYSRSPSGIAPEIVNFRSPEEQGDEIHFRDGYDSHNFLRPELVESLHILRDVTNDTMYQDWGWEIFTKWERYAWVATGGYTMIEDVRDPMPSQGNKMESFFLSETLKYLFLLFEDVPEEGPTISLDKYVFNTEGHPLPIWTPGTQ